MNYILINRIKVQNANAIGGFTWGFPAITHFLGFTHNLSIKLVGTQFSDIILDGCAVVCHEHQVHSFSSSSGIQFTQSRNPPYMHGLEKSKKAEAPPIIAEGKMNMIFSLLIGFEGNIGNREEGFTNWLERNCKLQRLAGGTVLSIDDIQIFGEDEGQVKQIVFCLLPGFLLMDRSSDLEKHYNYLVKKDPDTELLDAWLDFSALKYKARPKSGLIYKHLNELAKSDPQNQQYGNLLSAWEKLLESPYKEGNIPAELIQYFSEMENDTDHKTLAEQWYRYCEPNEQTEADWEHVPKPERGYLVPIMTGYKAISKVYKNEEIENTRDNKTKVCFVESVHGIGEWRSAHRIKSAKELRSCLWHYPDHYKEWYLCRQGELGTEIPDSRFDVSFTEEIFEEKY